MLDAPTDSPGEASPAGDARWHRLIDELLSRARSEEEFVAEVCREEATIPDSPWAAVAMLDQRFRLGHVAPERYRSVCRKIAQREMERRGELNPLDDVASGAAPAGDRVLLVAEDLEVDEPVGVARADDEDAGEDDGALAQRPSLGGGATINLRTYRWKPLKPASTLTTPQAARSATASYSDDAVRLPRDIEPGRVLRNRYVLESRLGAGGMGTVYKALDRLRADLLEDGRHVAVKILHHSVDADDMTRLRREFFCAQALSHPHIVKVYELDRDGDIAYFTMELLDGRLLSALIEESRPRAVPRTVAWIVIRDVAAALSYAHSRHVVHGDLKPQNIMVTESGEVRILDFGASLDPLRIRGREDDTGEATPAYASTEVLQGQPAQACDDLYALACISYELLSGEHPFQGHSAADAREFGLAPARPPMLTERQWKILSRVLDGGPEGRALSVADWVGEMLPLPAGPVAAPDVSGTPPAQKLPPRLSEVASVHSPNEGSANAPALAVVTSIGEGSDWRVPPADEAPDPVARVAEVSAHAAKSAVIAMVSPARVAEAAAHSAMSLDHPQPNAALTRDVVVEAARRALGLDDLSKPAPDAASAGKQFTPSADPTEPGVFLPRRPVSPRSALMPNSTLMIAVLICATVWGALAKPWSEVRLAGEPGPSPFEVFTQIAPIPVTLAAELPPALLRVADTEAAAAAPAPRVAAAPARRQLKFTTDSYTLHTGQRFAELHIVRSPGWDGDANFVWWTEAGSARPGTDYVQQNPAVQVMAKSQRRATLFIKIPEGSNPDRKTFYVAMTDPHGRSVSGVTRALVTIPPRRGHADATLARGESPRPMQLATAAGLARGH